MRRVKTPVPDALARERLEDFRRLRGPGPHVASTLAEVIWPGEKFQAPQGAGAAASRVLKRLGYKWTSNKNNWGWRL